ncbi:MAG: histidine--tRNA ligase [Bdellovibrionales bacterium]|nr:histidine--tRNA ligase [Bdellovibrionales bacterium]
MSKLSVRLSTEGYKGTRDFYPKDMQFRNWMFGKLQRTVRSFGYLEYSGPMLESFELYAAKTGEEIVNQQLYWMMDRGERKIAVRPEMTPTLARMVANKINELARPVRLYSIPNLWRYERPQRGRLREHWQLNVDVLGGDPLYADAEILQVAVEILRAFGGEGKTQVRINHRKLMDAFFREKMGLNPEQTQKVVRAVDNKDKVDAAKFQAWLTEAGVNADQMSTLENFFRADLESAARLAPGEGAEHLTKLFEFLKQSGVKEGVVVFDPSIMRGLDYYTGTVFEMYDTSPENRRAMFGGGRYDNLMGIFGKEALSGVGLGMGDVSLQHFLETHGLIPKFESEVDVMVTLPKEEYRLEAEKIASQLRERGLTVITPLGIADFGKQLKLANKHEAKFAVLFGDEEWKHKSVITKDLRTGTQSVYADDEVANAIAKLLRK